MICAFLGNRDASSNVEQILKQTLVYLIKEKNVDRFYVGTHGKFDRLVLRNLKELKLEYSHIDYAVVLAYLPDAKAPQNLWEGSPTIYPDNLEHTPLRYAIVKRNQWMIEKADYLVTYTGYTTGNTGKYKELAEKKGKIVLELSDQLNC